ncbi:glycosyltransferase 25 family member [Hyalella azteca]|uniref:Glycosyltransferase 25 family member n=1 Tax=Hyalella azteca TaxID=294128 RepID=A0A8B7PF21_HYAAZ|nr:glycosyltransferase 25 family member [Hyalella azteca]
MLFQPTIFSQREIFTFTFVNIVLSLSATAVLSKFAEKNNYDPLIYVFISARNKELALPYFLSYFDNLDYPPSRMILHVRADHCADRTIDILEEWITHAVRKYREIDTKFVRTPERYEKSHKGSQFEKDEAIISHMIELKMEAMSRARKKFANYILFFDSDVFLTDSKVISKLIKFNPTITAPMLTSSSRHSNFWAGMNDDFYLEYSNEYDEILTRTQGGCFEVALVHSCVLVKLTDPKIDLITFDPTEIEIQNLPYDDIITFSVSARRAGLGSYICNEDEYGFLEYPRPSGDPFDVGQRLINDLVIDSFRGNKYLAVSQPFNKYITTNGTLDTAGLSQIYYINLDRRPGRRDVIEKMLGLAGLKAQRVQGVDGKTLTEERMRQMGVKKVEGYLDSFHKRPITNGEIGCLISHHNIWKDVIKNDYSQVLILEDDAQLHPNFKGNLKQLLQEIKCIEWDLIFLGYKFVYQEGYHTEQVGDIRSLQTADYVYWAVGYLLSGTGAEKLVAANPLAHALPVDEFLPIMYDRTDLIKWKHLFPKRDLRAFIHNPPLLVQRFYKLDNGLYVSDTEETDVQESQVQISNLKKYESAKNAREKLAGPIGDDGKMEELSFSNERNKTTGLAWI